MKNEVLTRDVVCHKNSIYKFENVEFTLCEGILRLTFTQVLISHYARRKEKPFEYVKFNCVARMQQPAGVEMSEVLDFVRENWQDYILTIMRETKFNPDTSDRLYYTYPGFENQMELGQAYRVGTTKEFDTIKELYEGLVFDIDARPSDIDFHSLSGYANDNSTIHFNYQTYSEK